MSKTPITNLSIASTGFLKIGDTQLTETNLSVLSGVTDAGVFTGPAGVAGPNGPTGPTGTTGPTGQRGILGPTGRDGLGLNGMNGATGEIGPTGATGQQGIQGITGEIGPTGPSGGPTGETGPIGPTGPSGGPTGEIGPIGVTGPQGVQGVTGYTGPIGITGPTGPRDGPTGATGAQGKPGALDYLPSNYADYSDPLYLGDLPVDGQFYYAKNADNDVFLYMFIANPNYDRQFNIAAINTANSTGNNALLPTTSPGLWKAIQFTLDPTNISPEFPTD